MFTHRQIDPKLRIILSLLVPFDGQPFECYK